MRKKRSSFCFYIGNKIRQELNYIWDIMRNFSFNSTFTKLIRSYLIITTVILGLSVLTLYVGYKDKLIRQINNVSEKLLIQSDYFTEYVVNWTSTSGYTLYRDTNVFNLMYGKHVSYADEVIGRRKLKHAVSTIPLAHSIYIYNGATKKFYSSISDSRELAEFYDQRIISMLKNRDRHMQAKLTPRKLAFSVDGLHYKTNVLTMIVSDYPIQNGLNDGAVILNLNAKAIQNAFRDITLQDADVFIISNTGNVVSHSDPQRVMTDMSDEGYIQHILSSNQKSGYTIDVVNGKKSLITYVASQKLHFTFVSIIPYDVLFSDVKAMTELAILVFIVLLITGIVLSYVFSKQIYLPIGKITKDVQKYYAKQKEMMLVKNENELDFISDVLDNLLNNSFSLKNLPQVDINFLRQQLLKGLLLNQSANVKDLDIKFKELNVHIAAENLLVYVLRIDHYKTFHANYSKENKDLLRFSICNIASELTSEHFTADTVNMGEDQIAVMLNMEENSTGDAMAVLVECIERIQQAASQYLEISLTAGIGDRVKDLKDLPLCYKAAYDYTNYRFKYGPKSILFQDKIGENINDDYRYPEDKEKNVFDALKLCRIKELEEALTEMLNEISQYAYNDMLLAITQLTVNSKKLLKKLFDMDDESLYMDIRAFRRNLKKFENLDEVKSWLLDLYTNTVQQREEKKSNRKDIIVQKAIQYIEYNYCDPALSPELIADYVNISPNYLRSIYKEITNESLSGFINGYRLEKAKQLLETTSLPVREVSASIGFSNNTYFYTAFKKFYGVTPNQYRKHIASNHSNSKVIG